MLCTTPNELPSFSLESCDQFGPAGFDAHGTFHFLRLYRRMGAKRQVRPYGRIDNCPMTQSSATIWSYFSLTLATPSSIYVLGTQDEDLAGEGRLGWARGKEHAKGYRSNGRGSRALAEIHASAFALGCLTRGLRRDAKLRGRRHPNKGCVTSGCQSAEGEDRAGRGACAGRARTGGRQCRVAPVREGEAFSAGDVAHLMVRKIAARRADAPVLFT